jgi:hypothetical protein
MHIYTNTYTYTYEHHCFLFSGKERYLQGFCVRPLFKTNWARSYMNTIVFCFLEKKDTCKGFAFGLFSKPIGHVPLTILYASREQNSIDGGIQALLLRHLFTPLQHNIYASRDQSFIYGRYYLDIACAYCEEALIKSAVLVICHFLFFSGTTTADTTAGVWKAPVRTGTYRTGTC